MKVLCVGKCCLDIVNYLEAFPAEDSDRLCQSQRWSPGGNATNNCMILNQLALVDNRKLISCELFSSFGDDLPSEFVRRRLIEKNVRINRCVIRRKETETDGCETLLSTSCILINRDTGSRTIVHSRNNVRDADSKEFVAIYSLDELITFDWIHFEGRVPEQVRLMIDHVLQARRENQSTKPRISVEIEKPKLDMELLMTGVDYVFVGKDYAIDRRCTDKRSAALHVMKHSDPGSLIICPWGDDGAFVVQLSSVNSEIDRSLTNEKSIQYEHSCMAYRPRSIIDTLGCGDCFVSSFIYASLRQLNPKQSLEFATYVAGLKCETKGFDGQDFQEKLAQSGNFGFLNGTVDCLPLGRNTA